MAYKMTHPDSDQAVEVDASAVAVYESQGWETAKPAAKRTAKKAAAKKTASTEDEDK